MVKNRPPKAHQTIINELLAGRGEKEIEIYGQGEYFDIDRSIYATGFITCPAIFITRHGTTRCLHISMEEMRELFEEGEFADTARIDEDVLLADLEGASKVEIVSAGYHRYNEQRDDEIVQIKTWFANSTRGKVSQVILDLDSFQVVLTKDGKRSVWKGVQFVRNL